MLVVARLKSYHSDNVHIGDQNCRNYLIHVSLTADHHPRKVTRWTVNFVAVSRHKFGWLVSVHFKSGTIIKCFLVTCSRSD